MRVTDRNRLIAGLGLVAVGAVATVTWINRRIQDARDLQRLTRGLGSDEHIVAKIALAELTARDWLRRGDLRGAQLERANLHGADMWLADLRDANLEFANLSHTYLAHAKLSDAVMRHTNLNDADLSFANLQGVDFSNASLIGASLDGARLCGASLAYADLTYANLGSAIFDESTVLPDADFAGSYDANETPKYDKYWSADVDMRRYTDPKHADYWSIASNRD